MGIVLQHISPYDAMPLANSNAVNYIRYMEKLFVFSDLHGDVKALAMLVERIKMERPDQLICAGDVGLERLGHNQVMLFSTGIPISIVRGNCDSPWIFADTGRPIPPQYDSMEFGERTVFFTHGHLFSNWRMVPRALGEQDIFITGHTHRAKLVHTKGGPTLLNPGSVSSPRDSKPPSYAMIRSDIISIHELSSGVELESLVL